jgi:hypothetical protein
VRRPSTSPAWQAFPALQAAADSRAQHGCHFVSTPPSTAKGVLVLGHLRQSLRRNNVFRLVVWITFCTLYFVASSSFCVSVSCQLSVSLRVHACKVFYCHICVADLRWWCAFTQSTILLARLHCHTVRDTLWGSCTNAAHHTCG